MDQTDTHAQQQEGNMPVSPPAQPIPADKKHGSWFTVRRELEFLFIIVLAGIVSFFALRLMPGYEVAGVSSTPTPITDMPRPSEMPSLPPQLSPTPVASISPVASVLPSVVPPVPSSPAASFGSFATSATSQVSPDGKYLASLVVKDTASGGHDYAFLVSQVGNPSSAVRVYSASAAAGTVFSVPYNTFSPDDNYVFLRQEVNGTAHFLVFHTTAATFYGGATYLDVTDLFASDEPSYEMYQVTGWASNTLLVIETNQGGGTSFWFDVTNESFTPLATRF